jgi:hypothetical protein
VTQVNATVMPSASVTVGTPLTFKVTASGTQPITYQWRKDTVNIAGATGDTYTISSPGLTDSGNYDVVLRNALSDNGNEVASGTITVSVTN